MQLFYTIREAETLQQIAWRWKLPIQALIATNSLGPPSSGIYPGMRLFIPYAPPDDAGWIAYNVGSQGGSYDIWIYRPFDELHIQLTRNLGAEFSIPYWSHDSRKIAFIGKQEIGYVVDITTGEVLPNGSIKRNLAQSSFYANPVTWSFKGEKFAYISGRKNESPFNQIWLVDTRNPDPILLVTGGHITSLQWSPSATNSNQNIRYKKQSHSISSEDIRLDNLVQSFSDFSVEMKHQATLIIRYPHFDPY